ncbi:MAG TPA: hypothetical protein VHT96_00540 [Clostridia bacterium]|nr:hypothetical protein [Clostridia bacterium]
MSFFDLTQIVLFIYVMLTVLFLLYGITYEFQPSGVFMKRIKEKNISETIKIFVRSLSSTDYECFQKCGVWRNYWLGR